MYAETEGIILKQVKTVNNRRMVLLFSLKYGKISAGTSISEKSRSRAALAMRPFTHGKYELFKNRDSYNVNGAEVIKSYFKIGEDIEKYMCCSYILEFTERLLAEDLPSPKLFKLLIDFFEVIELRKKKYLTMVAAYQLKAMQIIGSFPEVNHCVCCHTREDLLWFSVKDGGLLCECCRNNIGLEHNETLICHVDFAIIEALRYFFGNNLKSFENIALDDAVFKQLQVLIKRYRAYHLDIGELKSENFLNE